MSSIGTEHEAGHTPGVGAYLCTKCQHHFGIKCQDQALPPCPECDEKTWRRATEKPHIQWQG